MSTLFFKPKGLLLPSGFIRAVLGGNQGKVPVPNTLGCALVENGELQVSRKHGEITQSFIEKVQEQYKEFGIMFWAGNLPVSHLKDDRQPFIVLSNDAGDPIQAAFLSGDFAAAGFGEKDSAHTPEFFAFNKYLRPKLEKEFRIVSQDMKKYTESLHDKVLAHEIRTVCLNGTGAIALMDPTNDECIIWAEKGSAFEFKDFWTSDALGYKEDAAPAAAPAPAKPAKKGILGDDEDIPAKPAAKPADKPAARSAPLDDDDAVRSKPKVSNEQMKEASDDSQKIDWRPPATLHRHEDIRNAYLFVTGTQPVGYKNRPKVKALPTAITDWEAALKNDTVKSILRERTALASGVVGAAAASPAREPDHVKADDEQVDKPLHSLMLEAGRRDKVMEKLIKARKIVKRTDDAGKQIIDLTVLADMVSDVPDVLAQLGLGDLEECYNWHEDSFAELRDIDTDALRILAINLRDRLVAELGTKPEAATPPKTEIKYSNENTMKKTGTDDQPVVVDTPPAEKRRPRAIL